MPKFIGKGQNFYLASCELLPSPNVSFEEKTRFHDEVCAKCGFWCDTVERMSKAVEQGKPYRKLMCVHPKNKMALDKWTPYITEWAVPPSV